MPQIIIYAKFRNDSLPDKKFSIPELEFYRTVCMAAYAIVFRYWRFRQMNSFLMRRGREQNFRSIISKPETPVGVYTDGHGLIDVAYQSVHLQIYFIGSSPFPCACSKLRGSRYNFNGFIESCRKVGIYFAHFLYTNLETSTH